VVSGLEALLFMWNKFKGASELAANLHARKPSSRIAKRHDKFVASRIALINFGPKKTAIIFPDKSRF
jgi:hypothetical protein